MRRKQRGSTLVEAALVITAFLTLVAGVIEFAMVGFAYNSICFAAHRATRFAAVRGSGSGHSATTADVQGAALANIAALDTNALTVTVTWIPDNHPGSSVQVRVAYSLQPFLTTVSTKALTLQCTSKQMIVQ